ncbi:hypothetical protein JSQ81_08555 [Sporosarcina sp. Marseille-Q4063]|uniref:DUF5305 family protein n=1 Tax=Sporosarcina sp. Marseille-Q4063 TaxID=2810514 RepID=UPI001BAF578F|nr:DUF5305 family protein [Sporosarcina sp. Marseille-Q4063]QUW23535.1 hypothetical protein JSQ81_08555 [Sporosarcina sp. Marseille-Q4063]
MKRIFSNLLNKKNKKLKFSLTGLLIIAATVSVSSFLQSTTTTSQINDNTAQFGTSYEYQATITPNILYPKGGTVDVENTIFKKITTAIPINLTSTIKSDNEVTAAGTYEIQLIVKAGELWERVFPLQEKQVFELKGTELILIDNNFDIALTEINSFITQVEEETGIRSDQYLLEVVPTINGTITYDGKEMPIPEQENLVFQSSYEEIVLISDKSFTSAIPFTSSEIITNTFNFFGTALPLVPVRIISMILSILLLLPIIYLNASLVATRKKTSTTQVDKINKKYGSRLIPVSQKINSDDKTMITLQSFKSIIKIADEKELPIFYYRTHQDGSAVYFIADGDYLYRYETVKLTIARSTEEILDGDEAYAKV